MAEPELGFWEFVHGTSAGGASIVAFEGMREFCHGGILVVAYAAVTALLFKWHHWHLKRVRAMRAAEVATTKAETEKAVKEAVEAALAEKAVEKELKELTHA